MSMSILLPPFSDSKFLSFENLDGAELYIPPLVDACDIPDIPPPFMLF